MSGGEIPREQFGFGNWKNRHVLAIGGIRSCEVGVESDSNQHCGESVDESASHGLAWELVAIATRHDHEMQGVEHVIESCPRLRRGCVGSGA